MTSTGGTHRLAAIGIAVRSPTRCIWREAPEMTTEHVERVTNGVPKDVGWGIGVPRALGMCSEPRP
jgi:hypothetical protein